MNYRPHHSKGFGSRGYDTPNPWLSEEDIFNMRRQTQQFHSAMQNVPSAIHPSFLNQNTLNSPVNKNFINPNSCNMSNMNFTCTPNPDIFKSHHSMNDSNFSNRLIADRFPGSSYSQINVQHKINEDLLFKDLPPPHMSHQFPKNDGFSENSQKLFSNIRSPVERFSCMQKDQAQFNRKYEDSQVFQGKNFPFCNKEMPSQLPVSFIDKVPASSGNNFPSCKSNYKAPSLFPAYTPKDNNEIAFQRSQSVPDEISKNIHQSGYSSDNVVEKAGANYSNKSSHSSRYSKASELFPGKSESFQEGEISLNEVFPSQSNSQSYLHEKSPFKPISNSPVPQDSLKTLESSGSSNSKFPFSSGNQDACFQSSSEIPFQTSQSMQLMNHSNTSTSRDCLMQNVPFSGSGTSLHSISESATISTQFSAHQSTKETFSTFDSSTQSNVQQSSSFNVTSAPNVHQNTKETFSSFTISSQPNVQQNSKDTFPSFNFESNMSNTDISDLLPGLDAFLKESCKSEETLNKSESVTSKNDVCKSSASNCAFDDDDELSKHSIPFIGDQVSSNSTQIDIKMTYCDQAEIKNEFESEKSAELKSAVNNESSVSTPAKASSQKDAALDKDTSKTQSALEEAIELLVKCDAIVGLDYIIEYKKNISLQGSFPFRCKLCNSSITRPSIIDHIIGSKHRMRYVKTKNESTYEYLVSLKLEKAEKDAKIAEAAFHMELLYGRGRVTVIDEYQPEVNTENKSKEVEDQIEETVFTLDKIPIGFEALSPQHEDMETSTFTLESDLNPAKQGNENQLNIEKEVLNDSTTSEMNKDNTEMNKNDTEVNKGDNEVSKEITVVSKVDSELKLPGLGDESPPYYPTGNLELEKLSPVVSTKLCQSEKDENKFQINPSSCQVKRSLSPEPSCSVKSFKTDFSEKSEECIDMQIDQKSTAIKNEESICDEKRTIMMDLLEEFSKSEISSHEEALMVLKIIGMFVQMLLRYDLPHITVEKLENMLSSLQVSSSEKNVVEDLKSLLKGSNFHKEIKEENIQKMEPSLQFTSRENVEQKVSTNTGINSSDINMTLYEPNVSIPNINVLSTSNESNLLLNTNVSLTVSETGINTAAQTAMSVPMNTTEVSKTISDASSAFIATCVNSQTANTAGFVLPSFSDSGTSSVATSVVNTQSANTAGLKPPIIPELNVSTVVTSAIQANVNTAGLKPPPFFSWPQSNDNNPVSYANTQSTQNLMWSNAYQFSQPYAQMSYYQPQSYGSHFSGTQSYQSQFPIIPQPPAPPLPPPPPSNPPLPPSVSLPANLHPSVPFNQPPPPPPPPLP